MGIGAFTDKERQPSPEEIHATMGGMFQGWHALVAFIRETYPVQEDFVFLYGKQYGWAKRFRLGGKLFTSLYPAVDGFAVQVILNSDAVERAAKMRLGVSVRQAISRAKPYPEGRWLFVPVTSMRDLTAVQRLLALKAAGARERPKSVVRR